MIKADITYNDGSCDVMIAQSFFVDRYTWSLQVTPDKRVSFVRGDVKSVTVEHVV